MLEKTIIKIQNLENHHSREEDLILISKKAVSFMWVFKVNYHPDGIVPKYKARLVAPGFFLIYEIGLNKMFFPKVRKESQQMILAMLNMLDFIIDEVDSVEA